MSLLEECINSLKIMDKQIILENNCKQLIINNMKNLVQFNKWGRIEWIQYINVIDIETSQLHKIKGDFYIIWNEIELPILKTNMRNILDNLDDVLAVDYDTWLLACDNSSIIEFYHNGDIKLLKLN